MAQRLSPDAEMARAFHHLQRAVAVISLVERESGDDLRLLLKQGIELYRSASGSKDAVSVVRCAFGLLRAAEHLGMAGLYAARNEYRVAVPAPTRKEVERHLLALGPRLDALQGPEQEHGLRLKEMARELLRQAEGAVADPHLEYELTMAADGICTALEEGL